jgi:hypothetical protein
MEWKYNPELAPDTCMLLNINCMYLLHVYIYTICEDFTVNPLYIYIYIYILHFDSRCTKSSQVVIFLLSELQIFCQIYS